jgi:Flp pilus assembly protein CpaB
MQLLPTDTPRRSGGPLSTKNGTFAVAAILALIAAAALLVFLREYRDDLTDSDPVQVLVARSLVPKGTPGDLVADQQLYKLEEVKNSQLEDGAITDPSQLANQVVVADIHPGHQLRSSDFGSGRAVQSRLSGSYRAMTIPVDSARGMIGDIEAGDRVDVVVTYGNGGIGRSDAEIAARDVLVLSIPDVSDGGVGDTSGQAATLRVKDGDAAPIASAVDSGEVWLVLRPAASLDREGR